MDRPTTSNQRTNGVRRAQLLPVAAVALALVATASPAQAAPVGDDSLAPATAVATQLVSVVVEGGGDAAAGAVVRLGGSVGQRFTVIDGFAAQIPAGALQQLRQIEGVRAVTPDSSLETLDERWGDDTTAEDEQATLATGSWSADHDLGSMFTTTLVTGAQDVWGKSDPRNGDRKLTGHGVGVAVIDTGVTPVAGLDTAGKVVNGADVSFDSQVDTLRHLDGYGHGTAMAGIIAGRDRATPVGGEKDKKWFVGMAPDAKLVNVKAGAFDGSVDVSQVIAGIDWVVAHRKDHNIRVLTLAYGTDSTQSYLLDPLAHAVESAWRAGIVVVVAAGNDGESGPRPLTMPAIDPYVVAVGSSDHRGIEAEELHSLGAWTNSGDAVRRPDLLAPGKSLVSLRVPGSVADTTSPQGRVTGDRTDRLFRGTGTSQSAAVVSGAAALLLQRNPTLTPDQVKGLLKASADRLTRETSPTQGSGVLDVKGAVELLEKGGVPAYAQTAVRSTGLGSLEAARGGAYVADPVTGEPLTGEHDIFGSAWDGASWAPASTAGAAWSGGTWRGTAWTGDTWAEQSWASTAWETPSWSGMSWRGLDWSGMSWRAATWSGMSWRGLDWSGMSWRAATWSGMSWRSSGWGSM